MAWNTSGRVMFASLLLSGCVAGVSEVHHSEADPDRPHDTSRGFRNFPLTGEDPFPGFAFLWRRLTQRWNLADLPPDHLLPPEQAVAGRAAADGDDSVTWIGHASFFLEIGGRHVLTDLVYADSVSPFGGFRRFVPPGLPRDALPRIDVVVISHNHHDHLDENFLRELAARDPETVAVVPLGLARVLRARGFALVHELDWGEHVDVAGLRFFAHSAMHESGRGMSDENRTLWATWVISTGRRTVLFAGDTGYSSTIFPWIGESHAKFDLAILPIGAYAPTTSQGVTHVTPEDAVRIGVDVNARRLVASHWGTFNLADEPPAEPPARFRAAALAAGYSDPQAWVLRIGETRLW